MSEETRKVYLFGPYVLDNRNRQAPVLWKEIRRQGRTKQQQVTLPASSLRILAYLVENPGKVILNEELLEKFLGEVEPNNLDQHFTRIKKALGEEDYKEYIMTQYGKGRGFKGEVIEKPPGVGEQPAPLNTGASDEEPRAKIGNDALAEEPANPPATHIPSLDDGKRRKRYVKAVLWSASVLIVIVALARLYLENRGSEPEKVFPQFGAGTLSDNIKNASEMKRELKDCQGNCLENVEKVLVIEAKLDRGGYATVLFNKPPDSDVGLMRQLVLKVKISTSNPKFEVGLGDGSATIAHFDCRAPTSGQEYDFLVNLDLESLTKNGSSFQPLRTRSFSIGFASDAGSTPGRQRMEVYGIVSSDNYPVAPETCPCEQRE